MSPTIILSQSPSALIERDDLGQVILPVRSSEAAAASIFDYCKRAGAAYVEMGACAWSESLEREAAAFQDVAGSWHPYEPILIVGRHRLTVGGPIHDQERITASLSLRFWGRGWVHDYDRAVAAFRGTAVYREARDLLMEHAPPGAVREIASWD